jgi:hypothetical protein
LWRKKSELKGADEQEYVARLSEQNDARMEAHPENRKAVPAAVVVSNSTSAQPARFSVSSGGMEM